MKIWHFRKWQSEIFISIHDVERCISLFTHDIHNELKQKCPHIQWYIVPSTFHSGQPLWFFVNFSSFKKLVTPGLYFLFFFILSTVSSKHVNYKILPMTSWTADPWFRKRPLYQLSHIYSHYICSFIDLNGIQTWIVRAVGVALTTTTALYV